MTANAKFQMAVESVDVRVRLIRVAGNLDRSTAASLLRMVDAQLQLRATGHCRFTDLLVDLENVRSFERGGLEAVRHARYSTGTRGVRIHLAGCAARFHLLPLRARQILGEFSTFPTVEIALLELVRVPATPRVETPAAQPPEVTTPRPAPQDLHDGPGDLRPIPPSAPTPAPGATQARGSGRGAERGHQAAWVS